MGKCGGGGGPVDAEVENVEAGGVGHKDVGGHEVGALVVDGPWEETSGLEVGLEGVQDVVEGAVGGVVVGGADDGAQAVEAEVIEGVHAVGDADGGHIEEGVCHGFMAREVIRVNRETEQSGIQILCPRSSATLLPCRDSIPIRPHGHKQLFKFLRIRCTTCSTSPDNHQKKEYQTCKSCTCLFL